MANPLSNVCLIDKILSFLIGTTTVRLGRFLIHSAFVLRTRSVSLWMEGGSAFRAQNAVDSASLSPELCRGDKLVNFYLTDLCLILS
jgi:hypothetical protein